MTTTETLLRALRALEEAAVPEDLREVAFGKAVDLEARTQTPATTTPSPQTSSAGDSPIPAIAARLGITEESAAELFHEDGDSLGIGVPSARLARGASGGTRQLAVLVSAGRQAGGYDADGWTAVSVIRDVCRDFNRLDGGNFANTITGMEDVFTFRGRGPQRAVRLTRPGWDQAKELVASLGGGER